MTTVHKTIIPGAWFTTVCAGVLFSSCTSSSSVVKESTPRSAGQPLTEVRIEADTELSGKILRVSLHGVYGSAVYRAKEDSWSDYGDTEDFCRVLRLKLDTAEFAMIPQVLPAGAAIVVEHMAHPAAALLRVKIPLAGEEWLPGKRVTYRISPSGALVLPAARPLPATLPHRVHDKQ